MALLKRVAAVDSDSQPYNKWFWWCPACKDMHIFADNQPGWQFNADVERPTVQSSIRNWSSRRDAQSSCHVSITDGVIHYLDDCSHALKGQTVPMVTLPDWLTREQKAGGGDGAA